MLKEILDIGVHAFLGFSCGYLLVHRWFLKKEVDALYKGHFVIIETIISLHSRISEIQNNNANKDNSMMVKEECSHNFCGDSCQ